MTLRKHIIQFHNSLTNDEGVISIICDKAVPDDSDYDTILIVVGEHKFEIYVEDVITRVYVVDNNGDEVEKFTR